MEQYDVIYVDGDHKYESALWDLCRWFSRVKPGGLLFFDDYGNIDTPEVSRAANAFFAICKGEFGRMGYYDKNFINRGKFFPAISRNIFVERGYTDDSSIYTYNDGSSARGISICTEKKLKHNCLVYTDDDSFAKALVICEGYVNCVFDVYGKINASYLYDYPVEHEIKKGCFYILPRLGTLDIEKNFIHEGMVVGKDFYTLRFPFNHEKKDC